MLKPDHTPGGRPATAPTRSYPAHWDRRIAPYAKIAAHERGLRFLHPVPVRFLRRRSSRRRSPPTTRTSARTTARELEHATGLLRALGLISGDVDLFKADQRLQGGASLAYYSFKDKRITVRGHTVTPAVSRRWSTSSRTSSRTSTSTSAPG